MGRSPAPTALKTTAARNAGVLASSGAKAPPSVGSNAKRRTAPKPPRSLLVDGKAPALNIEPIVVASMSENEDEDFEEVPIPSAANPSSPYVGTPTTTGRNPSQGHTASLPTSPFSVNDDYAGYDDQQDDENEDEGQDDVIRLEIGGETPEEKAKRIAFALRKKPMTSKDRAIRLEAHKLHVVALLASVRVRNRWCTHVLLKARLLSLLPHPLQAAFSIPPSRFPDRAQRSRLFFDALQSLVTWWSQSFFDISDPTLGLRTRPWEEVQEVVDKLPRLTHGDLFGGGFVKRRISDDDEELFPGSGGEKLRSVNSMMKKVLQQEGSRDVSAQLFVTLARACGLGVRLVASLQAVPWRAEKVVAKKKPGAGRGGRTLASRQGNGPASEEEESDEDEMEQVLIPGSGVEDVVPPEVTEKLPTTQGRVRAAGKRRLQDPADLYRLRKAKPTPQKVGTSMKPNAKSKQDLSQYPPVFWAEVFSRSDQRWIPVDPILGMIRKKGHFEPTSDSGFVRMLYVVAFEEDGYGRDVTLRYTKNFGAKTAKLRVPARKDETEWWSDIMRFVARPNRLHRDDLEDAELETSQFSEGMPMHMTGFKDHPIYVLERHLKREEVIAPKREIGRFRGEPVYRRANVLSCKTAENWMRVGRRVGDKQEPMKWVKQRAVTLQKRRAQELAIQEGQDPIQQGLYAESQTEIYRPPPIVDGIIPQNSFGNIDLYAPTMLPSGAVHLAYKGIAKVAKQLGINYAEACTGFEFKKQRAIPVITGIVVASEQEGIVLEAYWQSAAAAEEREKAKKEEKALKRWVKLINGLRVRTRLQAEYGTSEGLQEQQINPLANPLDTSDAASTKKSAVAVIANITRDGIAAWEERIRDQSPTVATPEPSQKSAVYPETEKDLPHSVHNEARGLLMAEVQHGAQESDQSEDADEVKSIDAFDLVAGLRQDTVASNLNLSVGQPPRAKRKSRLSIDELPPTVDSGHKPLSQQVKRERGRRKAPSTSPSTTRSLRSRVPKTNEQAKEEKERRRRVMEALESDVELEEI
ncbi:MAG: hypothetical protein TREMPRED_002955 [Tremellales sp. Tagirdzhanova-0007]|nr:MAG: hypothetical protein TREMPRED_002955 [Tremellales sp. Tagirdzhanova-0007]